MGWFMRVRIWLACKIAPEMHETNLMMYATLQEMTEKIKYYEEYTGATKDSEKGPRIN